ncbi:MULTISPECIES: GntR family transcriptional regulator [unclassified Streptomyces]|uniref:GntR family transcriptional regulator n=1 Tax=unclassified Streptomyces TaxID=2593676 RepID=UPI0036E6CA01
MEFDADRYRWVQVAEELRKRIADGTYQARQPMPSENQLIGEFGIARGTARKVIAHLRDESIVYTVPRLGTFVAEQSVTEPDTSTDTSETEESAN